MSFRDLLCYLLSEFGRSVEGEPSEGDLLLRLNEYLTEQLAAGRSNVLIIDEAQNMETDLLESIRMLSNLETPERKLLQIILAGQPELETKLSRPELRQLRQRISLKAVIDPLSKEETEEYIHYRLAMAGCDDPKLFVEDAYPVIWEYSRGIPRSINVLCDNALLIGYASDRKMIGKKLVREAIADLERKPALVESRVPEKEPVGAAFTRKTLALLLVIVLAGFIWKAYPDLVRLVEEFRGAGNSLSSTNPSGPEAAAVPTMTMTPEPENPRVAILDPTVTAAPTATAIPTEMELVNVAPASTVQPTSTAIPAAPTRTDTPTNTSTRTATPSYSPTETAAPEPTYTATSEVTSTATQQYTPTATAVRQSTPSPAPTAKPKARANLPNLFSPPIEGES
jgi:hypothetical protein